MPTTNTSSSSNPLPPKENALFKRILKCYEQKQYKNGLKFAKQILSNPKYSDHGETLAMKGLTLNCLGRKDEAYDLVRLGLKNDLRSHVCWHVYGLLQRSDKKYEDAIKCYRNALKWDKDNIQILRDLSLLQIQMRDLEGYKDTRYQLFQLRPTQRASWIGFAMSYHLLKDFDMALKILDEFRKTQQKTSYDYEHSELLLYQNLVIEESGDTQKSLEHLEKYQDQICDKTTILESKGKLFLQSKKFSEAKEIYSLLIKRNPENHNYYNKYCDATQCKSEEEKLDIFIKMQELYPKALSPLRLPLNFVGEKKFRILVNNYLIKCLRKGVPPLFVDLKPLYNENWRIKVIEELCLEYKESLSTSRTFTKDQTEKESVTTLLWLYYYLAQHYEHTKQYNKSLEMINLAIDHTPTLIELYMFKGKIYKHVGNLTEAVKWMDEAQSLDTADRYINCKCAKYMLRAGQIEEAEAMCQKFTREGIPAAENLNEMQCMWFQTECGMAYKNKEKWGEALKKCIEVDRHFFEIIEDQFDFHTYCMRKMTLRSYVNLLRLEDVIRSHRFYRKAARCAIDIYLRLHDKPLKNTDELDDLITEDMDPSELKKLRNKQKKAKRKAEKERQEQQQIQARKDLHNKSQKKTSMDDENDSSNKDELIPEKLERPENPLNEALKFLAPLQFLASKDIETHIFAFEIYFRKKRPLLMLQSIKRAMVIDKNHPELHGCITRLQWYLEQNLKNLSLPVQEVFKLESPTIFGNQDSSKRNEIFIKENRESLTHVNVGVKVDVLINDSQNEKSLLNLISLDSFKTNVDLKTCTQIYHGLNNELYGSVKSELIDSFRDQCSKLFPMASIFIK